MRWAVKICLRQFFGLYPQTLASVHLHLSRLGMNTTAVSRDYAYLMSPNEDETGRGIVSDAAVVVRMVEFNVYY